MVGVSISEAAIHRLSRCQFEAGAALQSFLYFVQVKGYVGIDQPRAAQEQQQAGQIEPAQPPGDADADGEDVSGHRAMLRVGYI